jgi:hypothetical protein
MKKLLVLAFVLSGCKSEAEKACFDNSQSSKNRVSACGEACDKNGEACAEQTKVGTDGCMTKKDAEVCRWMCNYGKTGQDLYCAEYEKITGHKVDEIPK